VDLCVQRIWLKRLEEWRPSETPAEGGLIGVLIPQSLKRAVITAFAPMKKTD
jgi:hypothetical protein